MPAPSNKPSGSPPNELTRRELMLMGFEQLFSGGGFLIGMLGYLFLAKFIGETYMPGAGQLWIGWTGCLLLIANGVLCIIASFAGLVVGWWLWVRLFAKRLALTKEEALMLTASPFSVPVVTGLCLRIAGVSKAEEKQLRRARRKRG